MQSKQNNVNNAQTAVNQAQSDVNNAKSTLDKAQQALVDAQDKANKTQQALNDAKTQRDNASQKVNSITDQLNSINTIVLPDGYQESDEAAYSGLNINHYKDNETDKQITVDPLHLTAEQQKELTIWIAGILNSAHKQLGFNNMNVVDDNSLKFAQVVADNYWDKFDHDISALDKAAEAVGGVQFRSESIGQGYIPTGVTNMNDLKRGIYNCMLDMIFNDAASGWGHAQQLLGIDLASFGDPAENFLGFSIDKNGILHFENYTPRYIDSSERYNILNDTSALQKQLENAQSDLQTKQAAFETATSNNNNAQNTLASAKTNAQNASQDLATKQATLDKANTNLNNAQQALKAAQAKLANDQELAKNAQEALDNLSADLKTKQANYDNAVKVLNDAKADLQAKQIVLANAKSENDKAQQALASAKTALEQAQTTLNADKANVTNLEAKLVQARSDVDKATAKLINDQDAAQAAKEALANLNADVKTKQVNLDKAKVELADKQADAQKALEQAQADLATAKANVEKAKAELKALQDKLANYENADEILANARKALVDAQAKLDKAKAAQTKEAEAVLAKFVAQEQAQKAIKEAEAKAKAQAEAKAKNTFFYVADGKVYDEKGHIMVGYTVKGNQIFNERGELIGTLTKEPTTRMMRNAVVKANVLPQTGNKKTDDVTLAGAVVTALGSVLALIGLGKRKDLD